PISRTRAGYWTSSSAAVEPPAGGRRRAAITFRLNRAWLHVSTYPARRGSVAAQKRPGSAGSGLKGFYWVLAAVALAGIAFLAYSLFRADRAATEPIELTNVEDARALLARAEGIKVGPDTAPARVVVFSDYQCPACGE